MAQSPLAAVRLWDLPVRLVHWSFALLIPVLWWTAEKGDLTLHAKIGLVMLGLVVFRLLWGLVGSSTARFTTFVRGPGTIRAYLAGLKAGTGAPVVGHNPLGGLSVVALLGLLALQVGLGLFAQDTDAMASGPLNFLVSWDTARAASGLHGLAFNLIVAFIVLHLAAIAWYRLVKKDDLVRPMVTGRKAYAVPVTAPRIAPLWKALIVALVAAAFTVWISWGVPPWGTRFPWEQPPAGAAPAVDPASYM